jgi:hypothetical protein
MLEILLILAAVWLALRSAAPYVLGIGAAIFLVAVFGSAIPRVLLLPLIIFLAIEGVGIMKGIFRGSDDGQRGPRQPMQP